MKRQLKKLLQTISLVSVLPLYIVYILSTLITDKDKPFGFFSQLLSLIPGTIGSYLRVGFYRLTMTHCAPDIYIGFATLFAQADTEIYKGVYIGPQCNIGQSIIEQNCLLGSGVHILSAISAAFGVIHSQKRR